MLGGVKLRPKAGGYDWLLCIPARALVVCELLYCMVGGLIRSIRSWFLVCRFRVDFFFFFSPCFFWAVSKAVRGVYSWFVRADVVCLKLIAYMHKAQAALDGGADSMVRLTPCAVGERSSSSSGNGAGEVASNPVQYRLRVLRRRGHVVGVDVTSSPPPPPFLEMR